MAGIDARDFRNVMGEMPTGVTVVTTSDEANTPFGMTISSFGSLSLDPPLVIWSVIETSYCMRVFAKSKAFAINVLAHDQETVSRVFCSPTDRFSQVAWNRGLHGSPLIEGAAAWIECVRESLASGGDHRIFIARVLNARAFDRKPLLHWRGDYGSVKTASGGRG